MNLLLLNSPALFLFPGATSTPNLELESKLRILILFERNHPLINDAQAALEMTDEQVDALFGII